MSDFAVVDKGFLDNGLSKVANSLKAKSGNNEEMVFPDGFEERINNIPESFWEEHEVFNLMSSNRNVIVTIKLPENITEIPQYFFYNMGGLVIEALPDTVESIGDQAFRGCISLGLKKLPDNLKKIGNYAFRQSDIQISELPDGLETIGSYAFLNSGGLTIKSIPASVKTLYAACFQGCTSLTEITFKGIPETIATNAFTECNDLLVINVPWSEGEVANAPWGASNATINYNHVESEG